MLAFALSYRRADVIAFWVLTAIVVAVGTGAVASWVGGGAPWMWGAGAAAAIVLPGLAWRPWFESGIWAWNGTTRRLASALTAFVTAVCYYLIVAAAGRGQSAPDVPGWTKIDPRVRQPSTDPPSWAGDFLAVARAPGNGWVATLFPLVLLLILVGEASHDAGPPTSTYTLY
jgi:hypothetical protein